MWLVRDGDVLAAVEVPTGSRVGAGGLLGRTGIDGVMLLRPCRNVHTFGMQFAIDVAFCDRDSVVVRTCTLRPWRISPFVWRARMCSRPRPARSTAGDCGWATGSSSAA